jgi:hypothetical protein
MGGVTEPAKWVLRRDGEELGTLTWTGTDQPFHQYRFDAGPGFDDLKPLFEEELQLLNEDRMVDWEAAYQRILDSGLRIESSDGSQSLLEFILHIDGAAAWMRHLPPGETF